MLADRSLTLFGATLRRELTGERILPVLDVVAKNRLAVQLREFFYAADCVDEMLSLLAQIKELALTGTPEAINFYRRTINLPGNPWQISKKLYHDIGDVAFHCKDVVLLTAFYKDSVLSGYNLHDVHPQHHSPDVERGFQALKLAAEIGCENGEHPDLTLADMYVREYDSNSAILLRNTNSISDYYEKFINLHVRLEDTLENRKAKFRGALAYAQIGSTQAIQTLIYLYRHGLTMVVDPNEEEAAKWCQVLAQQPTHLIRCFNAYFDATIESISRFSYPALGHAQLVQLLSTGLNVNKRVGLVPSDLDVRSYFRNILLAKAALQDKNAMYFLVFRARLGGFPFVGVDQDFAKYWCHKILDTFTDVCPVMIAAARALVEMHDENDEVTKESLLVRAAKLGCVESMIGCGVIELHLGREEAAMTYFSTAIERDSASRIKGVIASKMLSCDVLKKMQLMPYFIDMVLGSDKINAASIIHRLRDINEHELSAQWTLISKGLISRDEYPDLAEKTKAALAAVMPVKRLKFGS